MEINLDQVCTINVHTKRQVSRIKKVTKVINNTWFHKLLGKEPKTVTYYTSWWYFDRDEMYAHSDGLIKWLGDNDAWIDEDGVIYYKPHIDFDMSDDRKRTRWFDTEAELKNDLTIIRRKMPNLLGDKITIDKIDRRDSEYGC
jgi:hypothetical protein